MTRTREHFGMVAGNGSDSATVRRKYWSYDCNAHSERDE
jgi:hypothetical protein